MKRVQELEHNHAPLRDTESIDCQKSDSNSQKELIIVKLAASMVLLGAFWVLMVMFTANYWPNSQISGWIAVSGASFIFGASGIPMKAPSLNSLDHSAVIFSLFTCGGIFIVNLPLLFYLVGADSFEFQSMAIVGSADIMATNFFAFQAVAILGYSKAPAVWCSIGMVTAFVQGTLLFGETSKMLLFGILAIPILIVGVAAVMFSQRAEETASSAAENEETVETKGLMTTGDLSDDSAVTKIGVLEVERAAGSTAVGQSGGVWSGLVCCTLTGLCDGSLMAPFKLAAGGSQPSTVKVLSYVASFSLGSALLIAPLSLGYLLRLPDAAARATFLRAAKAAAIPALLSGMLWAQANVMSVHATAYLGMRVGFPLTQTCVVFAALWGVLFFGEMSLDSRDRLAWLFAGILAVLLGSYLLALSH